MDRPTPRYRLGDRVSVVLNDRNKTPHEGVIRKIVWHFKAETYHYWLEEAGRDVSKRYLAEDLRPLAR